MNSNLNSLIIEGQLKTTENPNYPLIKVFYRNCYYVFKVFLTDKMLEYYKLRNGNNIRLVGRLEIKDDETVIVPEHIEIKSRFLIRPNSVSENE